MEVTLVQIFKRNIFACSSQVSDICKQCRPFSHVNVILAIDLHYTVMSSQYGGGIEREEEQPEDSTVYSNPHCLKRLSFNCFLSRRNSWLMN